MYFTQEDYRKIEAYLKSKAVRDTSFDSATTPLQGNETIVLVQGGKNVNTTVSDIVSQFFALGVSDFINVTDKYGISYNTLDEAIRVIPWRSRKVGQVITFLNEQGEWHLYQYQGESILTWNNTTLWVDLLESRIVNSILPDQEDLTMTEPDADGNSYMHFKDKDYSIDDFSGLGRVYLRKNLQTLTDPNTGETRLINYLTQTMVGKENVIYHIQYDYNLNGQTIIIPEGCILLFEGGSIANGKIQFQETIIKASFVSFKKDITFSGTLAPQIIKSSWFEFDSTDCIDTLKGLLELSKDCTIHIENGTYNVSTKYVEDVDYPTGEENSVLIAQSNSRIILDGTIKLITNSLNHYAILSIRNKENIIVEGNGSIIGDVETHTGTTGEWGHGIQISSSKNITVKGISISKCWGDGITVSGKEEIVPTGTNILIDGIISSYNRRLGISLIAGDGIKLVNSTTHDNATISGTSPAAGLDIEPNKNEVINNVLVDNCIFYDNVVTYFPIGVIADKTVNVVIQNCLCNKHLFLGGLGTLKNNTIKYLYVNGCRLGNIKDNVITESLILYGSVNNLDIIGNTFRGLTNGGYDSCLTISASALANVNINGNYFNLDTNSSIGKFIKLTTYVADIDIYNSHFKYSKTGQLQLAPYGTYYNCTFETSGINLYNISDISTGAYSDKLAFVGCKFISSNSAFYVRVNITDTYKLIIEGCTYYTKSNANTDFINYIGHRLGLDLSVINTVGKSVTQYLINEKDKRPNLSNNYNGVRYINTSYKRPEYSIKSVWYDANGYLASEERNSDGTLRSKVVIV